MPCSSVLTVVIFLCIVLDIANAGDCEVCVGFLERLYQGLKTRHEELSPASVEAGLQRACEEAGGKEGRLCYYLGATRDAATRITLEVTRPMSSHVPVGKICERLQKKDSQICELRYEKQTIDLSMMALVKLRVTELKNILNSWGEVCRACIEKSDFVSLIQEVAPKHTKNHGHEPTDLSFAVEFLCSMHGFPCAALQHCFGSPTDVADSASSPTSEDRADVDAPAVAAVIVQPGPKDLPISKGQHATNCVPELAKKVLNGTNSNSNGHGEAYANGDHTSQMSISCHYEEYLQDGILDLASSFPHIPRPSIIKQQGSLLQEGLSEDTDQTETEDGTISGCLVKSDLL
ncbi:hypothetical protein AAFF_G00029040 [Aldrovandia affinis]|uniref:Uncharacterized protein n=1 Tax=Aldrovandia affinis TaxID=143900 RepID=A0AAD7WG24_9TELE|nr:hypothetical protein AAFF_G00029040 [Aldrovandia affinis]